MTTSCENNLLVTDCTTNTASSINNTATSCTMLEGALSSKANQHPVLDLHTLTVLWLINSGCNVEECLLEGNEMAGVNFGAFLPTDPKVLRLLLEAGAVEQQDVAGCEYESQVSVFLQANACVEFVKSNGENCYLKCRIRVLQL